MSKPVLYCASDSVCREDVVTELVLDRSLPFKFCRVTISPTLECSTSNIFNSSVRRFNRCWPTIGQNPLEVIEQMAAKRTVKCLVLQNSYLIDSNTTERSSSSTITCYHRLSDVLHSADQIRYSPLYLGRCETRSAYHPRMYLCAWRVSTHVQG
jgi:hypothetical protein